MQHVRAQGYDLDAQTANLKMTDEGRNLINSGDTVLVWVNEADLTIATMQPTAAPQSLDERMKAAGMLTLTQMLAEPIMGKFGTHAAMNNMELFGQWLDSKRTEYQKMRMRYELGGKSKDDDLWEWFFAHAATFSEVCDNFRAAGASTPHSTVTVAEATAISDRLIEDLDRPAKEGLLDVIEIEFLRSSLSEIVMLDRQPKTAECNSYIYGECAKIARAALERKQHIKSEEEA
ncbi:hypothetical protein [Parasedimentitalea psychrophila]|uniref:Uncharacterized protein n=1 Tax=Parasedimentitalea psychrophila TaxID=2997337 RepID=A0A9Y2NZI1_9RHOB|nr:hypothetical protein [Parasedimentitalea psychrophila]WIY23626.1 hypothetical protein QPJ95_13275 [Parasedimentitalea psychrophila]